HTAVLIMLQAIGHDSIRNLIAYLIGMAVADLFTGVDFTHWLSPPHGHMYQSSHPLHLPTIWASTRDVHSDFLSLLPQKRGTVLNFFSFSLVPFFIWGNLWQVKTLKYI